MADEDWIKKMDELAEIKIGQLDIEAHLQLENMIADDLNLGGKP